MIKLNSKTGIVQGSQEAVYKYVSDFRNVEHLLPAEKMQNLEITGDTIKFGITGLGTVGLKISEKNPYNQLVISATDNTAADFTLWMNFSAMSQSKSQVNLSLHANLNMFLEMMAKGPLQKFVDLIVDKLTEIKFEV